VCKFYPSRVASQAITRSIKQQDLTAWPTWGAITLADGDVLWQCFKVNIAFRAGFFLPINMSTIRPWKTHIINLFKDLIIGYVNSAMKLMIFT